MTSNNLYDYTIDEFKKKNISMNVDNQTDEAYKENQHTRQSITHHRRKGLSPSSILEGWRRGGTNSREDESLDRSQNYRLDNATRTALALGLGSPFLGPLAGFIGSEAFHQSIADAIQTGTGTTITAAILAGTYGLLKYNRGLQHERPREDTSPKESSPKIDYGLFWQPDDHSVREAKPIWRGRREREYDSGPIKEFDPEALAFLQSQNALAFPLHNRSMRDLARVSDGTGYDAIDTSYRDSSVFWEPSMHSYVALMPNADGSLTIPGSIGETDEEHQRRINDYSEDISKRSGGSLKAVMGNPADYAACNYGLWLASNGVLPQNVHLPNQKEIAKRILGADQPWIRTDYHLGSGKKDTVNITAFGNKRHGVHTSSSGPGRYRDQDERYLGAVPLIVPA